MPDRIVTGCPHCGEQNIYSMAELEERQPGARGLWRFRRPPPSPAQKREFVVTCMRCRRPFKVTLCDPRGAP